jgi:hypothetical protein
VETAENDNEIMTPVKRKYKSRAIGVRGGRVQGRGRRNLSVAKPTVFRREFSKSQAVENSAAQMIDTLSSYLYTLEQATTASA